MKQYKIYDWYEGEKELIGETYSATEVDKITKERINDTDGECYVVVEEVDIEHMADDRQLKIDVRTIEVLTHVTNFLETHKYSGKFTEQDIRIINETFYQANCELRSILTDYFK